MNFLYELEYNNNEINELVFYINYVFDKTNYSKKALVTSERIKKIIKNRCLENGKSFNEELQMSKNEWKEIYKLKCK